MIDGARLGSSCCSASPWRCQVASRFFFHLRDARDRPRIEAIASEWTDSSESLRRSHESNWWFPELAAAHGGDLDRG